MVLWDPRSISPFRPNKKNTHFTSLQAQTEGDVGRTLAIISLTKTNLNCICGLSNFNFEKDIPQIPLKIYGNF